MSKVISSKLKEGDKLSRISYITVIKNNGNSSTVMNEEGFSWEIGNDILEKECFSSNQYEEEIKVSRTELIDIFINQTRDTIFTVNFNKQAKLKDIVEAATARDDGGKFKTKKAISDLVKKAEKGEERILIGYVIKSENGFGRSTVIDLEQVLDESKSYDTRIRQVDHRSLNWLILRNIKYIVK